MSAIPPSSVVAAARRQGGRIAKFGGVGLANTAVDFAVYAVLVAAGAPLLLANVASFAVANAQSYLLNSRITFRDAGGAARISFGGYGKFLAAHLMSLAISTAIIAIFADRWGPMASKASAAFFTFVWNYATSAILVFRRTRATTAGGEASP